MVSDRYGITMKYPSSTTNEQSIFFPSTVTELNQGEVFKTRIGNIDGTIGAAASGDFIGWLEYAPEDGNDVKLLFLPSSLSSTDGEITIDVNCDLNHEDTHNQGYVNDSAEWQNVEITSHFFIKTVDKPSGYLFFEARNGYDGNKGGCCQGTSYGVRMFWDTGAD